MKYRPIEDRFWEKVYKTNDCWWWIASVDGCGYGCFGKSRARKNKTTALTKAHRFSYELHNGKIPNGMMVCHKCDNPGCVNPNHLFLGTQKDNTEDRRKKGRVVSAGGEKHGMAKLNRKQVEKIKKEYSTGNFSQAFLGKKYGVNQTMIGFIVRGCNWKSH